jgi:hypothetical protein
LSGGRRRKTHLEVSTETLSLERSPEEDLVDTPGLRRPLGELGGVEREGILETLDDSLVLEEEDGSARGS